MTMDQNVLTYTVAVLIIVLTLIYFKLRKTFSWEQHGVKEVKLGSQAFTDFRAACRQVIDEHGDTVGVAGGDNILITRDLDILRHVLVKDFNNFTDRAVGVITRSLLDKGAFFLNGQDWRRIRHIITPSFSSGKLKQMTAPINESAQKLTAVLEKLAVKKELVPIKYLTGQYTSEIIARSAFGLVTDCLGKEDDEFTRFSKGIIKLRSKAMNMVMLVFLRFPGFHRFLVKTLGIEPFDQANFEADSYFRSVLHRTIAEREAMERNGQKTPADLLQSLINAKKAGDKEAASFVGSTEGVTWDKLPKTMSDDELLGQSILIIFAGFETTSTTLQMCLYLLAQHPDIQEKAYQEIVNVIHSGKPTYEELSQLRYLEQVLQETLRLYPPLPLITRKALNTCTYGAVTIPKGAWVIAVLDGVMLDPKNYPDPEKFDPDRFSEENSSARDPMTWLPFGWGPRLCIGQRLAMLELKLGLVQVLRKLKVELNQRTEPKKGETPKMSYQGIIVVDKPIQLELTARED
ncbi:cytochrome P450 3A24-like [Physella acuta]|uniref:cytochrome P450 3A24-like n=1 Tax=Physella acuta TaxID=109671 RepID=UPI0027DCC37B|nr:cytochrome P450 3A24-like [Physella acuta]XP_059172341.1 cytochrome P450 3A24-like [Physella acuta]